MGPHKFSSPTDEVGPHNSPSQSPTSSLALISFSNPCGPLLSKSTSFQVPTSLLVHHLVSAPLQASASSLTHRYRWQILSYLSFPSKILKRIKKLEGKFKRKSQGKQYLLAMNSRLQSIWKIREQSLFLMAVPDNVKFLKRYQSKNK